MCFALLYKINMNFIKSTRYFIKSKLDLTCQGGIVVKKADEEPIFHSTRPDRPIDRLKTTTNIWY